VIQPGITIRKEKSLGGEELPSLCETSKEKTNLGTHRSCSKSMNLQRPGRERTLVGKKKARYREKIIWRSGARAPRKKRPEGTTKEKKAPARPK